MVLVLPTADAFTEGTASYGETPTLYARVEPWATDPVYGSGGTGFGLTPLTAVDATTAWFGQPVTTTLLGRGATPAVFTLDRQTGSGSEVPGALMVRSVIESDVDVEAAFSAFSDNATLQGADAVRHFGVGARIQGGTLTNSGISATEYHDAVDGYWLVRLGDQSTGYKFELLRVNGGTVTRLADSPTGSSTFGSYNAVVSGGTPFRLRLECRTVNVSDVELTGYVRVSDDTPVGQPAEVQLFQVTDTSGSKITAAGRCGLLMTPEWAFSGTSRVLHACTWFKVMDYGQTATHWLDDWSRMALSACVVVPSIFGASGRSLASGYWGDLQSNDATGFQTVMRRNSGGGNLSVVAADIPTNLTNPGLAYFVAQRRAADPRDQDRSIVGRFNTTGTTNPTPSRAFGVVVRAGPPGAADPAFGPLSGYAAQVNYDDGAGTGSVALYRISSAARTLIATGAETVSASTNHTLRLAVTNLDFPSIDGTVQLRVYFDGGQTTMVVDSGAPAGVSVLADGTVEDNDGGRITQGPGEGFYVYQPNGDRPILLDTWGEGAGAGSGTGEEDQASIAVTAENAGAIGTLLVPADWPVDELRSVEINRHEFDSDHVYTAPRALFIRRLWRITGRAQATASWTTLEAFWASHKGIEIPFTWVDPDGTSRTVCFEDDSLSRILRAPGVNGYSFTLVEVHA